MQVRLQSVFASALFQNNFANSDECQTRMLTNKSKSIDQVKGSIKSIGIRSSRLKTEFFRQPTLKLARNLLGKKLVTLINNKLCSGIIIEVEAYHGKTDPASHSYNGITNRNKVMFTAAGHCYVYFIYGNHFCVNVVSEAEGIGAAILVRALQPLEGIKTMLRRRKLAKFNESLISNGPGKLCQALGINSYLCGENLISSNKIWLESGLRIGSNQVRRTKRIGISKAKNLLWRFVLKDPNF